MYWLNLIKYFYLFSWTGDFTFFKTGILEVGGEFIMKSWSSLELESEDLGIGILLDEVEVGILVSPDLVLMSHLNQVVTNIIGNNSENTNFLFDTSISWES